MILDNLFILFKAVTLQKLKVFIILKNIYQAKGKNVYILNL